MPPLLLYAFKTCLGKIYLYIFRLSTILLHSSVLQVVSFPLVYRPKFCGWDRNCIKMFQVLTVVLMQCLVFWHIPLWRLVHLPKFRRHCASSKCQYQFTSQHGVTSQKAWTFKKRLHTFNREASGTRGTGSEHEDASWQRQWGGEDDKTNKLIIFVAAKLYIWTAHKQYFRSVTAS